MLNKAEIQALRDERARAGARLQVLERRGLDRTPEEYDELQQLMARIREIRARQQALKAGPPAPSGAPPAPDPKLLLELETLRERVDRTERELAKLRAHLLALEGRPALERAPVALVDGRAPAAAPVPVVTRRRREVVRGREDERTVAAAGR